MKRLLVLVPVVILAVIAAVVFWSPGSRRGPEPISYGRDQCAYCRMILSRPGFAGETRSPTGVLRKYDDVGCLVLALRSEARETPEAWVEDHESHELVPLLTATLVVGSELDTPMRHGILAFADSSSAESFALDSGSRITAFEALLRDQTILPSRKEKR